MTQRRHFANIYNFSTNGKKGGQKRKIRIHFQFRKWQKIYSLMGRKSGHVAENMFIDGQKKSSPCGRKNVYLWAENLVIWQKKLLIDGQKNLVHVAEKGPFMGRKIWSSGRKYAHR